MGREDSVFRIEEAPDTVYQRTTTGTGDTTICPRVENNVLRDPTDSDKVSDRPLCYTRTILGKDMFYCSKCYRQGTNTKGRWNTTHHTDGRIYKKKSEGDGSSVRATGQAVANLCQNSTKTVSFKDALSNASAQLNS